MRGEGEGEFENGSIDLPAQICSDATKLDSKGHALHPSSDNNEKQYNMDVWTKSQSHIEQEIKKRQVERIASSFTNPFAPVLHFSFNQFQQLAVRKWKEIHDLVDPSEKFVSSKMKLKG